jgi:hypothetical protein
LSLPDGSIIAGSWASGGFTGNDFTSAGGIGTGFSAAMAIFEQQKEKITSNKINILSNIR